MAHDSHHDEWFHGDHPAGQMDSHGDFNPYAVMGFLLGTIVITFLIVAVFIGWFSRTTAARKGVVQEARTPVLEYQEANAQWNADLFGPPRWLDAQQNRISVPFDVATREVVEMYGSINR